MEACGLCRVCRALQKLELLSEWHVKPLEELGGGMMWLRFLKDHPICNGENSWYGDKSGSRATASLQMCEGRCSSGGGEAAS